MRRAAENTQLYQIITVDGDELRFEARTATGELYDAFRLNKRPAKSTSSSTNAEDARTPGREERQQVGQGITCPAPPPRAVLWMPSRVEMPRPRRPVQSGRSQFASSGHEKLRFLPNVWKTDDSADPIPA